MHVNDKIYMIVFGESTLNDAVAIALSDSADNVREMIGHGAEPNYFSVVMGSMVHFLLFFFGSILIGCVLSLLTSMMFMKLELENLIWLETGLFLQCAYMPYIIAEAFN
jgi:NhaP-type Na+/H+ or K+/H+ antiporter